jgi:hypothetical protein
MPWIGRPAANRKLDFVNIIAMSVVSSENAVTNTTNITNTTNNPIKSQIQKGQYGTAPFLGSIGSIWLLVVFRRARVWQHVPGYIFYCKNTEAQKFNRFLKPRIYTNTRE